MTASRKQAAPGVVGRMYDLFCGYGGASAPFVDHGWSVTGFDNDPAVEAFYPGEFVLTSIEHLSGERLAGADFIWASPPCTDFSCANPRPGRTPERGMILVRQAIRVIREARPKMWVIENVRGAVAHITKEIGPPLNKGAQNNNGVWLWGNIDPIIPLMRKNMRARDVHERARVPYPIADAVRLAVEERL